MSTHSPILEFDSDAFPVVPDEDADTNPGVYGLSLARWLELRLAEGGWQTSEAFPEEFGWCVQVADATQQLYVACVNANEAADRWQVFAFVETGVFGAVYDNSERAAALRRLLDALRVLLGNAPEVRGLIECGD